jgi:outer membrane receptor protein involved in Fe transport
VSRVCRTWGVASNAACIACLLCASSLADAVTPQTAPVDTRLEEIVVTGTHLRNASIELSVPVTVLTRRDIERGGADSIGKTLQALPAITGSPLNTNVNGGLEPARFGDGGGDGSVRADLRGGSVVLLNGRRFPNSGLGADASVDLNTLPMSWIERVEVLSGGATAVYGADAVGGVINIITRPPREGAELRASRSVSGHGDGEVLTGQAAVGVDVLGGAWSLGLDYAQQQGVTLDRREYSVTRMIIVDETGTRAPAQGLATPQGRFIVPAGNTLGLAPGYYTRVDGATGQSAADFRPFLPGADDFNPAPYNYSQTPNERSSLWLLGSQPLGADLRFFAEGLLHHRASEQQLAPEQLLGLVYLPYLNEQVQGIPADNYYNPFGVDLLPEAVSGPATRRFVEAGNRVVSEDVDLWRALVGLEGSTGRWRWQFSAGASASETGTVERNFFIRPRFTLALGPSGPDDSGNIVCGPRDSATGRVRAADIVPGCVPLNLFGGAGSITREQREFLSPHALVHTGTNEQRTADLHFSGPRGSLFGQDVQWVLGAAYRRESGDFIQDPLVKAEIFNLVGATPVRGGHYDAKELFAEVALPLAQDRGWIRDLDVSLGVRWSEFSTFGQNTSWQTGLSWQINDQWSLRASYADVFRAPTIAELYDPRVESIEEGTDPCGDNPTSAQRANCASNGVPGGAYVQRGRETLVIAGGNTGLDAASGRAFGAGFVYTPSWSEGLSASADYSGIRLNGFVGQTFVEDVLGGCADQGIQILCGAIERSPNGSVSRVYTLNENLAWSETRAVDLMIAWHTATRFGGLDMRLLGTYLERWDEQLIPGGEVYHRAGRSSAGALPRWRALGALDWHSGRWTVGYSAQYIGSYTEEVMDYWPDEIFFPHYMRRVDAVLYHDLEAAVELDHGLAMRAAITNLLDEDPPYANSGSSANTDVATYRLLGRTYFLEMTYSHR